LTRAGDISGNLPGPGASLLQAIERIGGARCDLIIVIDPDGHMLGTVLDGDLRRGLMRPDHGRARPRRDEHRASGIPGRWIGRRRPAPPVGPRHDPGPSLDRHDCVVGLYRDAVGGLSARDNLKVIMAGGRGGAAVPLTRTCPRPMPKVAGRPLLETIIKRLQVQGFGRSRLAINNLAEAIEDHFGDGSSIGVDTEYLKEDHPRGTAGALSLLRDPVTTPMLAMNGDVLTRMALGDLVEFCGESSPLRPCACTSIVSRRRKAWRRSRGLDDGPAREANLSLAGERRRLLPRRRRPRPGSGAGSP